jgi:hypothetical protein
MANIRRFDSGNRTLAWALRELAGEMSADVLLPGEKLRHDRNAVRIARWAEGLQWVPDSGETDRARDAWAGCVMHKAKTGRALKRTAGVVG